MNPIITQILSLLTTPPGNLIYHLVLAFSIAGALQGAITQWRNSQFPQNRRLISGLAILLTGQLVLFAVSALIWQRLLPSPKPLHVLDRAISLFSLIWILWLWAFPEKQAKGDAATWIASLLVIIGLVIGFAQWAQNPIHQAFNYSQQDMYWQGVTLAVIISGALLLGMRKPNAWITGLMMLLLLFIGHLLQLVIPNGGDYPGYVRFMALLGYPILLTLPHRFPSPVQTASRRTPGKKQKKERPVSLPTANERVIRERRRYSTDPKAFATLLNLAAAESPEDIMRYLARSIGQSILADLCFLVFHNTEQGVLNIAAGYDLIREEYLGHNIVSENTLPLLTSSIKRKRPLRLPASGTSPDVKGLSELLGLTSPGHLLSIPLTRRDGSPWGAILLLAPYSERLWSSDDQAYLSNVSDLLAPILERADAIRQMEEKQRALQEDYNNLKIKVDSLKRANAELAQRLEEIQQAQPRDKKDVEHLIKIQEEAQRTIARLQAENEALRNKSRPLGNSQIESELRLTLEEVARLQNALAESNMRILELEGQQKRTEIIEQAEMIAAIAQELRQPMASIIGYTDLLLGESVGILGALQRKFMERVKAAAERVNNLIDDLINLLNIEAGSLDLKPESVDINLAVENAISYTATELRKKKISLQIDIPKDLKSVHADRDGLQQILIHLLQNAGAASPENGTIQLRIHPHEDSGKKYVMIQITDSGVGIEQEDIPRVFTRLYRADNRLIEGLGDTGIGLSIAKTLTEAHGGRIWVDTQKGVGSTFSVILPIEEPV